MCPMFLTEWVQVIAGCRSSPNVFKCFKMHSGEKFYVLDRGWGCPMFLTKWVQVISGCRSSHPGSLWWKTCYPYIQLSKARPPFEKYPSQRPPPVRWKMRLRTKSMFCPVSLWWVLSQIKSSIRQHSPTHLSPSGRSEHWTSTRLCNDATIYWER